MGMYKKEIPVFFDESGKRWVITENCITLLIAAIGILAYWFVPLTLAERLPPSLATSPTDIILPVEGVAKADQRPSVSDLMRSLGSKNIAVIGSGPLVRLAEVDQTSSGSYLVDPFSEDVVKKLNEKEIQFIDGDTYALQRYGEAGEKRLFLTFDDGPDHTYTPELLDVLSSESVPSSFFVTGANVARFPEIARRVVHEGHSIGNHTFSHVDFDMVNNFRSEQEINQTERLIAATTGHATGLFRPPYGGSTDQSLRNSLRSILTAQHLGYSVVSFDFDSDDWHFTSGTKPVYPTLDGKSKVILLHDGGGDRSQTISYVKELIRQAKDKGYTFSNLDAAYPPTLSEQEAAATLGDQVAFYSAQALLVWPRYLVEGLFAISIASLLAMTFFNIILAIIFKLKTKPALRSRKYRPSVTIILPAYNEEAVLEKSVRSLLRSRYRKMEVTIVDDGSTDATWQIAISLAKRYKRVTAIHQVNGGKSSALNNAIARSKSDIVICADADTIFPTKTIMSLIRHFEDEEVGAVAGVVKVGNPGSMITKWQALEYATGISIERNAQALLGAIMIVPGACGAWRRNLLVELGGFSNSTLAEDCDLALKIQSTGKYKILQDNNAVSYTEAPQSMAALTKQRFRWTFGNIQALWKHRKLILSRKHGWLGLYVMPSIVVSILIPILFWPFLISLTLMNIISGNYMMVLLFFFITLAIQFIISLVGIILAKEKVYFLLSIPFGRLAYGPIRIYILYKTVLTILKGVDVGWNKLARTGTAYDPLKT